MNKTLGRGNYLCFVSFTDGRVVRETCSTAPSDPEAEDGVCSEPEAPFGPPEPNYSPKGPLSSGGRTARRWGRLRLAIDGGKTGMMDFSLSDHSFGLPGRGRRDYLCRNQVSAGHVAPAFREWDRRSPVAATSSVPFPECWVRAANLKYARRRCTKMSLAKPDRLT